MGSEERLGGKRAPYQKTNDGGFSSIWGGAKEVNWGQSSGGGGARFVRAEGTKKNSRKVGRRETGSSMDVLGGFKRALSTMADRGRETGVTRESGNQA